MKGLFFSSNSRLVGVATRPGATALTVIPKPASSLADVLVRLITPALAAPYSAEPTVPLSPAIEVIRLLQEAGAEVRAFEPFKPEAQISDVVTVSTLENALEEADVLLLLVAHQRLLALEPTEMVNLTPARTVIDAVNGWTIKAWQDAGFGFKKLGQCEEIP